MIKHILTLALCLAASIAHADGKKLVVVVARGSSLTNISRVDLKRCFERDPVSSGDKQLVPFNASSGSPERIGFDRAVLGMDAGEVGRFWVDRKVRGQSDAPRALPSAAYVVKVVAKFPGAIGYVTQDQLTPELQPVKVEGVAYTDPSYSITSE